MNQPESLNTNEKLDRLIAEQRRTIELLEEVACERRAAALEAERQRIAKAHGVHPSQVAVAMGDDGIIVHSIRRDPRHAPPAPNTEALQDNRQKGPL